MLCAGEWFVVVRISVRPNSLLCESLLRVLARNVGDRCDAIAVWLSCGQETKEEVY